MLELNDTVGEKGDIKKVSRETDEKISSLFNSTMFGDNTTIIIGNDNIQKTSNNSKFTFDSLRRKFEDNGMNKEDIDELAGIIDNDNPNNEKKMFGEKVQLWMSKMLAKAMNASWEISLSTAGTYFQMELSIIQLDQIRSVDLNTFISNQSCVLNYIQFSLLIEVTF